MHSLRNGETARHATIPALQPLGSKNDDINPPGMDPIILANLDFDLFTSLCKLGVSRKKISMVLSISDEDFEYLSALKATELPGSTLCRF